MKNTYEPINANRIQCVREAVKALSQYNISIINRFMKSIRIYSDGTKKEKLNLIENRVSRSKNRCKKLYKYIDELKMMGNQHVFLFSFNEDNLIYIEPLNKLAKTKKNTELAKRLNEPLYVWKSISPQLAEVTTTKNKFDSNCVILKWNQTREYRKLIGNVFETIKERTTDFFIINLQNGTAQLRIQCLPSGPFRDVQKQYNVYLKIIKRLIGFKKITPFFLEPIMQKMLHQNLLPVTYWYIKSRLGNLQGNKGNPVLLQRLRLFLFNYILHSIRVYWVYKLKKGSEKRLYFTLNSYANSISFESIADQSHIDFILDQLRMIKVSQKEFYKIKTKELVKLAKDYEDIRPIFVLDYYIKKWKKRKIKSSEFADETGFDKESISDLFKMLAVKYPSRFTLEENKDHVILKITTIAYDGLVEKLTKKTNNKLSKTVIKGAGISVIGIFAGLSITLINWGIEKIFQRITGLPFILVEIIPFIFLLIPYYGSKRVKKYLYSAPFRAVIVKINKLSKMKPEKYFNMDVFKEQYKLLLEAKTEEPTKKNNS